MRSDARIASAVCRLRRGGGVTIGLFMLEFVA
jgi:hypothetical protein